MDCDAKAYIADYGTGRKENFMHIKVSMPPATVAAKATELGVRDLIVVTDVRFDPMLNPG